MPGPVLLRKFLFFGETSVPVREHVPVLILARVCTWNGLTPTLAVHNLPTGAHRLCVPREVAALPLRPLCKSEVATDRVRGSAAHPGIAFDAIPSGVPIA